MPFPLRSVRRDTKCYRDIKCNEPHGYYYTPTERVAMTKPGPKIHRIHFTKTLIESLPYPEHGQVLYRDSEVKGLGVRVTPGCKTYVVEGVVNGTRKRWSIGRCGGR
jgi:hypothetical protein